VIPFASLKALFSLCENIDDMTSTHQANPNILIDGFSVFYGNRAQTFIHSEHIFDEEFTVRRKSMRCRRRERPHQSGTVL
jgi:hypothetical protein